MAPGCAAGITMGPTVPDSFSSSADTHAMVARVAPAILELLGDGLPRSRHDIVAALAPRHAKEAVAP